MNNLTDFLDLPKLEKRILTYWQKENIFEKLYNREGAIWSFLDGPITANNPMGIHHAWGRTYKDLFCRYKSMCGFKLKWQNGFDCHGLWVEVEIEKEKGFKNKQDVEQYGLEKFSQDCAKQFVDLLCTYSDFIKNNLEVIQNNTNTVITFEDLVNGDKFEDIIVRLKKGNVST